MSAPNELHLAVAAALDAGLAVIPPMQNGTKRPIDLWKDYQTTAPSREQVREWYGREGYLGLGVLTGAVSGIEMLELEGRAIEEGLLLGLIELAETTGLGELVARIEAGYAETTPSGGLHWLYRVDPPLGNTKLAKRPATATELEANPADKVKVLIETRGEGGFVITAPSNGSVHPSGGRWTLTEGGFATIATITAGERDALFDLARAFDRMPKSDHRRPAGPTGSDRPGDRYNAAADAQGVTLDVLLRHGWTRVYSRNGAASSPRAQRRC
jgi:putative DNA primase/helicase